MKPDFFAELQTVLLSWYLPGQFFYTSEKNQCSSILCFFTTSKNTFLEIHKPGFKIYYLQPETLAE